MPTIADVAKMAGVSTATVSRTFRSPSLLTEETQQRVRDAARKLDYRPRGIRSKGRKSAPPSAPTLQQAHQTIGFQFFADRPEDTLQANTFYAALFLGAQREAAALGLHMLVHTTDRHQAAIELPKMLVERAISGLLLVGTGADARTLSAFAQNVPHLVLLDSEDETGRFECVISDGFGGMQEATRYLIGLGHRRIGFILAEENVLPFRDRLHGYVAALFDAGIAPDPRLIIGGRFEDSEEQCRARLKELVTGPDRPTALLVANDQHAYLVLQRLQRIGLRVPDDISLIGFDDIPFSNHVQPPLTTVHVDKEEMGRLAVRRLYSRMHNPADSFLKAVRNEVPVSLVLRQSCRRL